MYVEIIIFINVNTKTTNILVWKKSFTEIQILSTLKLYDIKWGIPHIRGVLLLDYEQNETNKEWCL